MDASVKEGDMNVQEMLAKAKKGSKADDVPGTVEAYLDELCPACGKKMKLMKPCCSEKHGSKKCVCGYRIIISH